MELESILADMGVQGKQIFKKNKFLKWASSFIGAGKGAAKDKAGSDAVMILSL